MPLDPADIAAIVQAAAQAVTAAVGPGMTPEAFAAAVRAAISPDPPAVLKRVKVRAPRAMLFEVTVMTDLKASVREIVEDAVAAKPDETA